jgi:hypothetical protein
MKLYLLYITLLNYKFNPDSYRDSKRHYKCRLAGELVFAGVLVPLLLIGEGVRGWGAKN